jgi:hypothetical protein
VTPQDVRGAVILTAVLCGFVVLLAVLALLLGWAPSLPKVAGG